MVAKRKRGREERPNGEDGGRGGGGGKGNLPPLPFPLLSLEDLDLLSGSGGGGGTFVPPLSFYASLFPFSRVGWGGEGGKFFMQARYAFSASSTLGARIGGEKKGGGGETFAKVF